MNNFNIEQFLDLTGYDTENTILNIRDVDGNGYYDINDFLEMNNKDILNMNDNKKWDLVLMNPPYGEGTNLLHLEFVDKCLDISKKQVIIMPFNFIKLNTKTFKKYKEHFNEYLYDVEEVDSKLFSDTSMPNVGIYLFNDNKRDIDINIKYLNNTTTKLNNIFDNNNFSKYEEQFIKYLDAKDNINYYVFSHKILNKENGIEKWFNKFNDNNAFLLTNITNGSRQGPWNPNFISNNTGMIYNTKFDAIDGIKQYHKACIFMKFNSIKSAKNCRNALLRPLLRFTLLRTQTTFNILEYCYKYIPNIDWSDDRVKTDEGLLEVCGCPKNKCKEYADYCKKIIEEVDKK